MKTIKTCEFVSPKHPDKICDFIADSLLDEFMKQDPASRVAVEVMGGHQQISISGEVTSKAKVDAQKIVQSIVGADFGVNVYLVQQSLFISQGVDIGGARDQGIAEAASLAREIVGDGMDPGQHFALVRVLGTRVFQHQPRRPKILHELLINGLFRIEVFRVALVDRARFDGSDKLPHFQRAYREFEHFN